jgi:hypothetical protein
MLKLGIRGFATTARRAADTVTKIDALNQHGISVSKAQGVARGLTGGKLTPLSQRHVLIVRSNWKYTFNQVESYL